MGETCSVDYPSSSKVLDGLPPYLAEARIENCKLKLEPLGTIYVFLMRRLGVQFVAIRLVCNLASVAVGDLLALITIAKMLGCFVTWYSFKNLLQDN